MLTDVIIIDTTPIQVIMNMKQLVVSPIALPLKQSSLEEEDKVYLVAMTSWLHPLI